MYSGIFRLQYNNSLGRDDWPERWHSADLFRNQAVLRFIKSYLETAGRISNVLPLLADDLRLISERHWMPSLVLFKRLSDQPLWRDLLTSTSRTSPRPVPSQFTEDAVGMKVYLDWIYALYSKICQGVEMVKKRKSQMKPQTSTASSTKTAINVGTVECDKLRTNQHFTWSLAGVPTTPKRKKSGPFSQKTCWC